MEIVAVLKCSYIFWILSRINAVSIVSRNLYIHIAQTCSNSFSKPVTTGTEAVWSFHIYLVPKVKSDCRKNFTKILLYLS